MNNGKHGQGTHCTKMSADSFAKNTPSVPEFICPTCLPKPKSSGFQWKKASLGDFSLWVLIMAILVMVFHVLIYGLDLI